MTAAPAHCSASAAAASVTGSSGRVVPYYQPVGRECEIFEMAYRQRLPLLDRFDLIVDASHTGILKPDPRAYAAVTDGLRVAAADCVFVDDQLRNVDGARRAGMQVVHFDVRRPVDGYRQALALLGIG